MIRCFFPVGSVALGLALLALGSTTACGSSFGDGLGAPGADAGSDATTTRTPPATADAGGGVDPGVDSGLVMGSPPDSGSPGTMSDASTGVVPDAGNPGSGGSDAGATSIGVGMTCQTTASCTAINSYLYCESGTCHQELGVGAVCAHDFECETGHCSNYGNIGSDGSVLYCIVQCDEGCPTTNPTCESDTCVCAPAGHSKAVVCTSSQMCNSDNGCEMAK